MTTSKTLALSRLLFGRAKVAIDSEDLMLQTPPVFSALLWAKACGILRNPAILEQKEHDGSTQRSGPQENTETLKAQRQRLQHHGMDRLIDSLAEGVIEKDQFTARMNRTKARIADIDAIAAQSSGEGQQEKVRWVRNRLADISSHVRNQLSDADWTTKREIIRALVQRIEIGPTNVTVVLRLPTEARTDGIDPVMLTLSRACSRRSAEYFAQYECGGLDFEGP